MLTPCRRRTEMFCSTRLASMPAGDRHTHAHVGIAHAGAQPSLSYPSPLSRLLLGLSNQKDTEQRNLAPQTELYLVPQAWQKQGAEQSELPRLPGATLPCSVRLPQLNASLTLHPLSHRAQLTFLGQHGDEGTDELIVIVGSPLVINLQRDDKSTNGCQGGRRAQG